MEEDLPRADVVLEVGWGDGPEEVPPGLVTQPYFSVQSPRELRPVFAVRPCADGGLLVLADPGTGRFLHRSPDGRNTWLTADPGTEGLVAWSVMDFLPDGTGGVHLLEFLDRGEDRYENRVRHVDATGRTTWSRAGAVDPNTTDPAGLVGIFTGLQRPAGGRLWAVPRATSAGLLALDPPTGEIAATIRLDADITNLLITPDGRALHARMTEERVQVLASTDLSSGQVTLGDPGWTPLLDLAGMDEHGHVYARAGDGIARVSPPWRLYLYGIVHGPESLIIAYGDEAEDGLHVVEHGPEGDPARAWTLPLSHLDARSVTLVDVEPGPRFVLQVNGSSRTPGKLVTVDRTGAVQNTADQDVAEELIRRESRLDLTQTAVDHEGAVLVPMSDPRGYRVIRLRPPSGVLAE